MQAETCNNEFQPNEKQTDLAGTCCLVPRVDTFGDSTSLITDWWFKYDAFSS